MGHLELFPKIVKMLKTRQTETLVSQYSYVVPLYTDDRATCYMPKLETRMFTEIAQRDLQQVAQMSIVTEVHLQDPPNKPIIQLYVHTHVKGENKEIAQQENPGSPT